MRMIKGLLTLRPWVWSNDHSSGAGGEAPDTDTSSASSSSSQSHHQSFPGPKCLSVSSLHLIRPDANYDLAPSGWEEKSEWEHRNTILDLTWKIRIECGPPGVSYNVTMLEWCRSWRKYLIEINSGLGQESQESLHMSGLSLWCRVELSSNRGECGQHQTTADCIRQCNINTPHTHTSMLESKRVRELCNNKSQPEERYVELGIDIHFVHFKLKNDRSP